MFSGRGEAVRIGNAEPSAARCSGLRLDCRVEGSLPSYDQAQGSGLSCRCPHLRPEGEVSLPYARLGARSPAPRRFRVGLCPAGWSSQPHLACPRLTRQKSSQALSRSPEKSACGPRRAINYARVTHVSSELPPIPVLLEIPPPVDRTWVAHPMISGEAYSNDARWGISTTPAWTSR